MYVCMFRDGSARLGDPSSSWSSEGGEDGDDRIDDDVGCVGDVVDGRVLHGWWRCWWRGWI